LSLIRILVVDDFKDWLRQVRLLLQSRAECQVIAEASDGLEAVRKAQDMKPDLILLDISLPKLNGIEAARRIRQRSPSSKIIFLSQNSNLDFVRASLGTGALGYVLKTDAGRELLPAVNAVLGGKEFFSSSVKGRQFTDTSAEKAGDSTGMSRLSKVLIGLAAVVVASAALFYVRTRFAVPTDKLEPVSGTSRKPEWPPGEPTPINFAAPNMSSAERREFLTADYRIVRNVAVLPAGIRKLHAIADPGERFEATDVITDPDLPTRRLIFAGVAQDRAFIHYEEGGIAHSYIVELFRLESPDLAVGLWSGYRGPTKNLEELKRLVAKEDRDLCCNP